MELIRGNAGKGQALRVGARGRTSRCAMKFVASALLLLIAQPPEVWAEGPFGLDEIRLGIFDHNIEPSHSEAGVDVNIELLFRTSNARYDNILQGGFFSPAVHFGASINSAGDTNVAYGGLSWTLWRNDWMFVEASFGGAVHDGPLDKPGRPSYGCAWSFRESGSVGFTLDANWQLLFTLDHMSNADLCDANRGLTNAGVRLGYRFGG